MSRPFRSPCALLLTSLCLACSPSAAPSKSNPVAPPAAATPQAPVEAPPAPTPQANEVEAAAAPVGWSPAEACVYLEQSVGLKTGKYKQVVDNEYGCTAPYKVLGEQGAGLANNLAYYVEGDAQRAVQLKLVLNVNNKAQEKSALSEFRKSAEALTEKASGAAAPAEVSRALSSGKAGTWTVQAVQLEVRRDDWPTGKGYSVHYLLRRAN